MNIKQFEIDLWNKGKSASDYPKDWIVIPVQEVIELIEENLSPQEIKELNNLKLIKLNGEKAKNE